MNILTFACVGLLVGVGFNAVLTSKHMLSAVLMLVGGVLLLIHRALVVGGHGKAAGYLASTFSTLALIAMSVSVYFF